MKRHIDRLEDAVHQVTLLKNEVMGDLPISKKKEILAISERSRRMRYSSRLSISMRTIAISRSKSLRQRRISSDYLLRRSSCL